MLVTKSIQFQYKNTPAFFLPDFQLKGGDELLIIGKSGSGKTTLLHILGGLLKPHNGEVLVNGTSIYQLRGNDLDKFRGKHIGIVFQKPHLLSALTVKENILLANYFVGENGTYEKNLKELDIYDKRHAKISSLSEGEAQRVSIARALANQPAVILADEPTSSLDDENAASVIKLLQEQATKLNAVLVIVTHDQRVKNHISNQIVVGG